MMFLIFTTLLFAILFAVATIVVFILIDAIKKEQNENQQLKIEKEVKSFKNKDIKNADTLYFHPISIKTISSEEVIPDQLTTIGNKKYIVKETQNLDSDTKEIEIKYMDKRDDTIIIMPNKRKLFLLKEKE